MAEIWTYRIELDADVDLVGYDVEADDGHAGKIDEASHETGDAYIVVDTGFWIFGKKRLLPARAVKQVNVDTATLCVDMTKDEVKDSPHYHAEWREPDHRESFASYTSRSSGEQLMSERVIGGDRDVR